MTLKKQIILSTRLLVSFIFVVLVLAACPTSDLPRYTLTYNGNGESAGTVPIDANSYGTGATVTVLGNTGSLSRSGFEFIGWNTSADGSGTSYSPGQTFTIRNADVVLFAKWEVKTYTIIYHDNGASSGMVPTDSNEHEEGAAVTVMSNAGDLMNIDGTTTAYYFDGWNTMTDGSGTTYAPGDTFTIGTSDASLYAIWTPFIVGDIGPAGGFVFYDQGNYSSGWRYLEAAPSDTGGSVSWGEVGTDIPGAAGTAIGTGKQNTADIIDSLGTGSTYAAQLCEGLISGGYDDWFLPSQDELNLVYQNVYLEGVGDFFSNWYYSSSEYTADNMWAQSFYFGTQDNWGKNLGAGVLAVRSF